MKKKLPSLLKATLALSVLTLASPSANAANLVFPKGASSWDMGMNHMHAGDSISASDTEADKRSYTSNPDLQNASWGHFGSWYTFMTHNTSTTTISVTATDPTNMSPGFTVWRTDGEFDGGTGGTGEQNAAEKGTPHSFNQLGAAGSYGTWWMTDNSTDISDSGTNDGKGFTANGITKTMGYANDGVTSSTQTDPSTTDFNTTYTQNGWGESLTNDGNQDGYAELTLANLEAGWYLVFMGGADGSLVGDTSSKTLNLNVSSVSAVPVPAAVYLFGSALVGLFASSRRKLATTQV